MGKLSQTWLRAFYWSSVVITVLFLALYVWFLLVVKRLTILYPTVVSNVGFYIHIVPGNIIYLGGALQFSSYVRQRWPAFHRITGYIYFVSQFISTVGIAMMLTKPEGGVISGSAGVFYTLAWFWTAYRAYAYIRLKEVQKHREWMLYNFGLSLAIIAMRPLTIIMNGMGYPTSISIGTALWLGWGLAIVIVRIYILEQYYGGAFRLTTASEKPYVFNGIYFSALNDWTDLALESRTTVAKGVDLFRFALPLPNQAVPLRPGQHMLIRINGEIRPYTPVNKDADAGTLDFIIKEYAGGKVSTPLHFLQPGGMVSIKGPIASSWSYTPNSNQIINMVAGGSGITPFIKIIDTVVGNVSDNTKINLLYCNRFMGDIILKKELDALVLQYPDKVRVNYSLTNSPPDWVGLKGRADARTLLDMFPVDAASTVLVCGNNQMNASVLKMLKANGWNSRNLFAFGTTDH